MSSSGKVEQLSYNRRVRYRRKLRSLAHVKLDSGDSGVLRDIGDNGIAIQVLSRLAPGQPIHLALDLPNPRLRFEAEGRVVWSDSLGQAGILFVHRSPRARRLLQEWLFTQILVDTHRALGDDGSELLFSHTSRPFIRLAPRFCPSPLRNCETRSVPLLWLNVPAVKFSRLVDGTVLACAVLLFSLLVLFFTDVLPSWPFSVVFVLAAGLVFTAVYWFVFAFWFGITPGTRLAELASSEAGHDAQLAEAELTRFR
ncbi:MAG TPA: PilZ domain-containing protein [Terriglobales bacterium]|nr:PilZ domain-containing protein [Terriglobales bacterium]